MIGYQGASPAKSPDFFERSIQCYTPLYPGADWADAPFAAYDSYWKKSSVVRPVNLARENGKIKPGETFVIWVYTAASHRINCTLEQFRSFWSIPDGTKVFILDGNDVDGANNFKLKNDGTGTYIIMHGSERFPARRSADKKFDVERDNKRSPYTEATYETLDEVISWAVVDFGSEPLASVRKAEGGEAKTNRTVSYLPAAEGQANGSFASNKRMHISKVNDYASSAAGRLDDAQKAALSKTKTAVVRTVPSSAAVAVNDNKRPSLIITAAPLHWHHTRKAPTSIRLNALKCTTIPRPRSMFLTICWAIRAAVRQAFLRGLNVRSRNTHLSSRVPTGLTHRGESTTNTGRGRKHRIRSIPRTPMVL